jgi:lipopolysaccharide export system protein LptA
MKKATSYPIGGLVLVVGVVFCVVSVLGQAASAPKSTPPDPGAGVSLGDMSSIFGPGSQLQAAPDGEFNISIGADDQLETFRAVKDVILLTKENDLRCDEMTYDRPKGLLVATAQSRGLVNITMRSSGTAGAPGVSGSQGGDTRATCGHYEYYINEKRHILTENPIIYQKDKQGKEAAILGKIITLTQNKFGKWDMHVKGGPDKGGPAIIDPKRRSELERARAQMGNPSKPVMSIDTATPKTGAPSAKAPAKALKIDEGNVGTLQRPKPTRVLRLEEGG